MTIHIDSALLHI